MNRSASASSDSSGRVYRFKLVDDDGAPLGQFVSTTREWQAGTLLSVPYGVVEIVRVVDEPGSPPSKSGQLVVRRAPGNEFG